MDYHQIRIWRVSTSAKEIFDIVKAWAAISFAFAILESPSIFSNDFYRNLIIVSLTVGLGFLLHELGHKLVAQRYGCYAEFRSYDFGLLMAVLMSFAGFIFAAPGAVMIAGKVNRKKNGIIAVAGPIVNIILALSFLSYGLVTNSLEMKFLSYGFSINAWLALFNMIPFGFFDGKKIIDWNKGFYFLVLAASIVLFLISFAF